MEMQCKIGSFAELHSALRECLLPSYWLFRGQSDAEWELLPKCARQPYCTRNDKDMFGFWKRKAIEVAETPPADDWHWLALAQHHGFATRLLDWSSNPLVAAFFACNENMTIDGALYAYLGGRRVEERAFKQSTPWEVKEPIIFNPYIKNRRVFNQSGNFTISNEPEKCFSKQIRQDERMIKLLICKDYKKDLLLELSMYGINWGTLYPDLDGNSKLCNWYVEYGEKYLDQGPTDK